MMGNWPCGAGGMGAHVARVRRAIREPIGAKSKILRGYPPRQYRRENSFQPSAFSFSYGNAGPKGLKADSYLATGGSDSGPSRVSVNTCGLGTAAS